MLKSRRRLTWEDVDYARVGYYPRYSLWVDEAFHEYLFEHGFRITELIAEGYGLPYISTSCRYLRKLTLEDEVDIEAEVAALDAKGFTLRYRITKVGDAGPAAEGDMVRRCIRQDPPKSVEMPQNLRAILEGITSR